jgi:hypothetical protein
MYNKMEQIGLPCQGKWVQVDRPYQRTNLQSQQHVNLPKGAVGYCYGAYATGVIYVGFFQNFQRPAVVQPYQLEARRLPVCVSFTLDDIHWLSLDHG